MGGVRTKVLVAILLRPPEKNLCKQLLGSYLVLAPPPPPLGISALSGDGGMDIFWNYTIQKKCNFRNKRLFNVIIFNDC